MHTRQNPKKSTQSKPQQHSQPINLNKQLAQLSPSSISDLLMTELTKNKTYSKNSANMLALLQQINEYVNYLGDGRKTVIVPMLSANNQSRIGNRISNFEGDNHYIQIYTIKDNKKIRYRTTRKRPPRQLSQSSSNSQQSSNLPTRQKSQFNLEQTLCLNSLILAMMSNQTLHVSFGVGEDTRGHEQGRAREHGGGQGVGVDREEGRVQGEAVENLGDLRDPKQLIEEQQQQRQPQIDQYTIKQLQIFPSLKTLLSPPNQHEQLQNSPQPQTFPLKSLTLELYSSSLTFLQFILCVKIIKQLMEFLLQQGQKGGFNVLEKLEIGIYDKEVSGVGNYVPTLQFYPLAHTIFLTIYQNLEQLLHTKTIHPSTTHNRNHRTQIPPFPKLTELSFNPTFFIHYRIKCGKDVKVMDSIQEIIARETENKRQEKSNEGVGDGDGQFGFVESEWREEVYGEQKIIYNVPLKYFKLMQQELPLQIEQDEQEQLQYQPITTLTLLQLPPSICLHTNTLTLLQTLLPYTPKLSTLTLLMQQSPTPHPNEFTKLLQLLSNLHQYTPYLQSLTINNNSVEEVEPALKLILAEYPFLSDLKIREGVRDGVKWMYMKEIWWRKLHVHRMINMVRVLAARGYDRWQAMSVLEFMKPLNLGPGK